MHVGVGLPKASTRRVAGLVELAVQAEQLGFDSV
jgi:hypothetical protein